MKTIKNILNEERNTTKKNTDYDGDFGEGVLNSVRKIYNKERYNFISDGYDF